MIGLYVGCIWVIFGMYYYENNTCKNQIVSQLFPRMVSSQLGPVWAGSWAHTHPPKAPAVSPRNSRPRARRAPSETPPDRHRSSGSSSSRGSSSSHRRVSRLRRRSRNGGDHRLGSRQERRGGRGRRRASRRRRRKSTSRRRLPPRTP
jgi:hypothetical protein